MIFASFGVAAEQAVLPDVELSPIDKAGQAIERLLQAEDLTEFEVTAPLGEAAAALSSDPSPEAKKILNDLQILVGHIATIQGTELKHSQNIYYRELYRGVMFASNISPVFSITSGKYKNHHANWLADTLVDVYFKLYAAEINLHYIVNDAERSPYFPQAYRDLRQLNCEQDAGELPKILKDRLVPFCDTYRTELQRVGFGPKYNYAKVAKKANEALKTANRQALAMRERLRTLVQSNKGYPEDKAFLADDIYAGSLVKAKSCLATFFHGSNALNSMLRKSINYDLYRKADEYSGYNPLIPYRSPFEERIQSAKGLSGMTEDKVAFEQGIDLLSAKRDLMVKSREHRQIIVAELERLENLMQSIEKDEKTLEETDMTAPGVLRGTGPIKARLEGYERELESMMVHNLAQYPQSAGVFWSKFSREERMETYPLLSEASKYFDENAEVFAKNTMIASILLIGTLFIPGGQVVIVGGIAIRLAFVAYLAILGAQAYITVDYMARMKEMQARVLGEEIFPHADPFHQIKAADIDFGLRSGYLSIALLSIGETLGFAKVGEHMINGIAVRFVNWVRYMFAKGNSKLIQSELGRTAVVLSRRLKELQAELPTNLNITGNVQMTDDALNMFAKALSATGRPGTLVIPTDKIAFQKTLDLVTFLEKDVTFQTTINSAVLALSTDLDRKMFLEAATQVVLRDATVASSMGLENNFFKQLALKSINRAYQARRMGGYFNVDMMMVSGTTRRQMEWEMAPMRAAVAEFTQPAAVVAQIPVTKYNTIIANMSKRVIEARYNEAIQLVNSVSNIGPQLPLIRAMAQAAIDQNKAMIDKLALDPVIQKAFFAPRALTALRGHELFEDAEYIDKAIRLAEIIDHNLFHVSSSTLRAYSALQIASEKALLDSNSWPVTTEAEILEINQSLTNVILKSSTIGEVSKEFFNPANIIDCSVD